MTIAAEYGPGGLNTFSRPIDAAFAALGVAETPGHPNRGPMVDQYIRFVGLDPTKGSYEWCCAAIVYWCHQAGLFWVPRVARVYDLWTRLRDLHSNEPRVGDAFIHLKPDGKGHTGLVASFDDRFAKTIEGNSNMTGSRVGNAVVRGSRDRMTDYIKCYIRLDKERYISS